MNGQHVNMLNVIIRLITHNTELAYIIISHSPTSRPNIARLIRMVQYNYNVIKIHGTNNTEICKISEVSWRN